MIKYEAEVRGHEAPFMWTVYRTGAPGNERRQTVMNLKGEADTFENACFAAAEAAREAEYTRHHAATKETVELFKVEPQGRVDADVPVAEKATPEATPKDPWAGWDPSQWDPSEFVD